MSKKAIKTEKIFKFVGDNVLKVNDLKGVYRENDYKKFIVEGIELWMFPHFPFCFVTLDEYKMTIYRMSTKGDSEMEAFEVNTNFGVNAAKMAWIVLTRKVGEEIKKFAIFPFNRDDDLSGIGQKKVDAFYAGMELPRVPVLELEGVSFHWGDITKGLGPFFDITEGKTKPIFKPNYSLVDYLEYARDLPWFGIIAKTLVDHLTGADDREIPNPETMELLKMYLAYYEPKDGGDYKRKLTLLLKKRGTMNDKAVKKYFSRETSEAGKTMSREFIEDFKKKSKIFSGAGKSDKERNKKIDALKQKLAEKEGSAIKLETEIESIQREIASLRGGDRDSDDN